LGSVGGGELRGEGGGMGPGHHGMRKKTREKRDATKKSKKKARTGERTNYLGYCGPTSLKTARKGRIKALQCPAELKVVGVDLTEIIRLARGL